MRDALGCLGIAEPVWAISFATVLFTLDLLVMPQMSDLMLPTFFKECCTHLGLIKVSLP